MNAEIILIMISAGILGGIVNIALKEERPASLWSLLSSIVAGIGASLLTPLFLRTISSNLLPNILKESQNLEDTFVFGGFCLLAAIVSRAFIQTLSSKVLEETRKAQAAAERATQEGREAKAAAEGANETALAATDSLRYGLHRIVSEDASQAAPLPLAEDFERATSGVENVIQSGQLKNLGSDIDVNRNTSYNEKSLNLNTDDPWAGKFGGLSTVGHRQLLASIYPIQGRPELRSIKLTVRSTAPEVHPLRGFVTFFLHPTFANSQPKVEVAGGEAHLNVIAWGAFTVGATADDGKTRLECDLSKHPQADESWRSR